MSKASQTYDEMIVGDVARQKGLVDGEARKGGKRFGSGGGDESSDSLHLFLISGGYLDLFRAPGR